MEKKGPFQVIEIRKPEIIGEFATVKKYAAMVTDAKDQAVYNAILDAAKKAGINSLLLMDRRFVLNALEVAIKRQEMLDSCSDAPTIEAEPVRHGRWTGCVCSECRHDLSGWADASYEEVMAGRIRYCPNCGAKMDLEG